MMTAELHGVYGWQGI